MITYSLLGSIDLPNDAANVTAARRWVRDLLGAEHPASYGVEQCVSELVTNGFQHTESPTVSIAVLGSGAAVRIEVVDAGAPGKGPHLRRPPDNDQFVRGRGLHLVNGLAEGRWGSWVDGRGRRTTRCEVAGA